MKIDLGYSYDGPTMASEVKPPSKNYPTVHIDCGDLLLNALPDEGTLEATFKVVSRSTNERNGKKTCSLTIELRNITDVNDDTEADENDSPAEALDKLARIVSAKQNSEE